MEDLDFSIGIYLGTTNSSIGFFDYYKNDTVLIHYHNDVLIPSFVSLADLEKDKTIYVGGEAKDNPNLEFALFDSKRLIGKSIDDISVLELNRWPFQVEEERVKIGNNYETHLKMYTKNPLTRQREGFYPFEVSGFVLKHLHLMLKDYFSNVNVKNVVVTVPTNFNEEQRKQTLLAAELAGFEDVELLNEPTAAIIEYKRTHPNELKNGEKIMVIDFGGETLDVCLCEYKNEANRILAYGGDPNLGGNNFDRVLMEIIKDKLEEEFICRREYFEINEDNDFDDEEDDEIDENYEFEVKGTNEEKAKRLLKLKREAERIKIEFSKKERGEYPKYVAIHLGTLMDSKKYNDDDDDENFGIYYEEFKERCKNGCKDEDDNIIPETQLIKRFKKVISDVLRNSRLKTTEIDKVLMIGGSCAMRLTQEIVLELFKQNQIADTSRFDPSTTVCKGAAFYSHSIKSRFISNIHTDTIPNKIYLKIDDEQYLTIANPNDSIPISKEFIYTPHNASQKSINLKINLKSQQMKEKIAKLNIPLSSVKENITIKVTISSNYVLKMKIFTNEVEITSFKTQLIHNQEDEFLEQIKKHFNQFPIMF